MSTPVHNPWLHRCALLTAVATLLLLGAGGLVTSHGVGMAVPDWPNTYGYNMFFFPVSKWVGGIFYEHTHRLIASGVGLLTGVLALWLYGGNARPLMRWLGLGLLLGGAVTVVTLAKHRADGFVTIVTGVVLFAAGLVWPRCEPAAKWLRRLGLIAFLAVVLQGVLGGLRVVLFKDQIGIFHATLAQLFFTLTCALALVTSKWWQDTETAAPAPAVRRGLRRLALVTTLAILGQLVLGATMRHQHAGLAIPDFPLAYGRLWPAMDADSVLRYNQHRIEAVAVNSITAFQIGLQMAHRLMALAILAGVAGCAWLARRRLGARTLPARLTLVWLGLIVVQAGLGAWTIWSNKAADIATAHVLVGALSLATGALWCLVAFPRLLTQHQLQPVPAPRHVPQQGSFDVPPALAAHS